jgi:hypothetical protein
VPRFTNGQIVAWSRKIADADGVITWDTPIQKTGLISQAFMDQLRAVGEALKSRQVHD